MEKMRLSFTMWPDERVLAFLDILGVGAVIERISRGERELLQRVLLGVFHLSHQTDQPGREQLERLLDCRARDFQYSVFSDSVVISDEGDRAVLTVLVEAGWRAASVLRSGLLCRGALARGWAVHTPGIIVGAAIVDAYRLEKSAVYPRILLADNVAAEAFATSSLGYVPISQDDAGHWYLDVFDFLPKPASNPAVWPAPGDSVTRPLECAGLPMDQDVQQEILAILEKGRQDAHTADQAAKWTWLLGQLETYDTRRTKRLEAVSAQVRDSERSGEQ